MEITDSHTPKKPKLPFIQGGHVRLSIEYVLILVNADFSYIFGPYIGISCIDTCITQRVCSHI